VESTSAEKSEFRDFERMILARTGWIRLV